MGGQQDEVEGPAAAAVVVRNLPEAVPRRQRLQVHVQSESHVRQMQVVGEDPRKFINQFSTDFQRDFVALLRTAHGEKWISSNKFYNEYIRDKEHVHVSDLARKLERDGADSSR